MSVDLPVIDGTAVRKTRRIALVGNPNAGKSTLFNALTGLKAHTANYPGVTVDLREGRATLGQRDVDIVDLPGLYSLDALSPEEEVARMILLSDSGNANSSPASGIDAVVLVVDETHLERNLALAAEVLALNLPTVVALTLSDIADAEGIATDIARLQSELGCEVVRVSSRTHEGLRNLGAAVDRVLSGEARPVRRACGVGCSGCVHTDRFQWAAGLTKQVVDRPDDDGAKVSRIDRVLTHPVLGVLAFVVMMLCVFYAIFALADVPMTLVDEVFGTAADIVSDWVGEAETRSLLSRLIGLGLGAVVGYGVLLVGQSELRPWKHIVVWAFPCAVAALSQDNFRSLIADGVIGGIGGVVIFLPQICILFFFIALLEDSGYMARAAFVMERLMRLVGLPGKAFVPMLSSHACAIPGIMATRVIEDWRDRLATILVLPLLTCSARLPVYAMVTALLFGDRPWMAAATFTGAYVLGIVAALGSAWVLKKTILPGKPLPLMLELPSYRLPSLRNALLTVLDRAKVFLQNAGTTILVISLVLWAAATFPGTSEDAFSADAIQHLTALRAEVADADDETAEEIEAKIDNVVAQQELANSFAGRIGRAIEPVFRPLGFDWKIDIGVLTSFAAREVVVSTLAVVYGVGEEAAEEDGAQSLVDLLRRQERPDGTLVFDRPTCFSLLVFYVLAMQCLPTQAVTKRETGSWKWAILQLVFMTVLAYAAAFATYRIVAAVVA